MLLLLLSNLPKELLPLLLPLLVLLPLLLPPSLVLLLLTWQVQAGPEGAKGLHGAVQRSRQRFSHQLLHLLHYHAPCCIQVGTGLQRLHTGYQYMYK